jgi:hypothetical protein
MRLEGAVAVAEQKRDGSLRAGEVKAVNFIPSSGIWVIS